MMIVDYGGYTDTDDLFIYAIAPHEGVRVDDLPPMRLWRGGVERGNAERSAFKIWAMVVVIIMNIRLTL